MPYKDPAKQAEYLADHNRRNRPGIAARKLARRRAVAAQVNAYKLAKGCERCDYDRCAEALEAHHVGVKNFEISDAIRRSMSFERILVELALCIILCANCHAEEHAA